MYAAEKALKDYGEKVGDDIKKNVQDKIDAAKTARGGTDAAEIKRAGEELSSAMSAIGEAMSKTSQAQPTDQKPEDGGQGGESSAQS